MHIFNLRHQRNYLATAYGGDQDDGRPELLAGRRDRKAFKGRAYDLRNVHIVNERHTFVRFFYCFAIPYADALERNPPTAIAVAAATVRNGG